MYLCVTLPMLFIFMESHAELLQVVGPENPIKAVAGEDLVLPCNIVPSISAVDMTVEWYRLDVADMLVHLYKDREDRNEKQAQTYRGRTSVFKEELQKGNASLKLSALTLSDEGEYKCLVVDKSRSKDITVHVVVEVQGSKPVITIESYDTSGGINLVCGSRGWKPEPKVLWMDRNGATLPAEDTQIHRDNELFSVKSRITVHVHDKSDSNRFYCRLQQNHHMKETEVIINSPFFAAGKKIVGILVSACLAVAVGLIFISVLWYKKEVQKKRIAEQKKQKNNDDQQIQTLKDENKKLEISSEEQKIRIEEQQKQKTKDDQQIQDLKDEIKELKNNAEAQKKTIEEQQNQKKKDDKQMKELNDAIQNLQNFSDEQKMKIEEQQKQKTKDDQQIQDLKDEIKKLKNNADQQIQVMEKDIKELKDTAEAQKKRIEEQQNQKNNDDQKIKELEEEIQKLQKISEEQKKKIEEHQKQKKEDDKQIKKLKEEHQKQKTEDEDQKRKIEEQQKQKKEDDEKIKKLEEEIQKLQKKSGIQQPEDKSDVPPPQPTDENQLT